MPLDRSSDLKRIGGQFLVAVVRFLVLLAFMGMHWLLTQFTPLVVPEGWEKAKTVIEVTFFAAFLVLYLEQILEMLAIFLPILEPLRATITQGHTKEQDGSSK
jgi:hypothetical protein